MAYSQSVDDDFYRLEGKVFIKESINSSEEQRSNPFDIITLNQTHLTVTLIRLAIRHRVHSSQMFVKPAATPGQRDARQRMIDIAGT